MKNVNSRFQLVDIAALNPGECLVTKTPNGPFIDTGLTLSGPDRPIFRGRVYLSVEAIREMAEQAGLFDPYEEKMNTLKTDATEYSEQRYGEGYSDGYDAKVDATAGELVDRMRARVARDRGESAAEPTAASDDSAAEPAPEPGAEAAGVEGLDDVPSTELAGSTAA